MPAVQPSASRVVLDCGLCGPGFPDGLTKGSYWDVSRDVMNSGWATQVRGIMFIRPETPMTLGYITEDTSQLHPCDVLFNLLFLFIVAHRNRLCETRYRLVTTGEAGDSRNVDGTPGEQYGFSAPACVLREEEAQKPLVRPLGGPA